ncbi:PREDICTED: uncharacterized protein LOC105623705 [Atta cephalotes]|uniref:Odorant receptor n=1 Tax=Atta cephalotes TaxID=12957 RepID=A0A158NSH2_ATTCE|nr:PREDICTED: uncharacterized protein LOC105623705 [Atta cephalotes]
MSVPNRSAPIMMSILIELMESRSVIWRIHGVTVWLIELIHTIALIVGMVLAPKEKSLKDGTIAVVIILEASFMLTRLYLRKKLMEEIIEKMNDILQNADEIMKDIIKSAIKPIIMPFIIYGVTGVVTVATWTIQPILLVFEKSIFYYVDYNLPTAFNSEPFSSRVLIFSTIFMTIGSSYLFLKKFGVDVYMMHLVLMLTAQYRYMAVKLTILFRDLQNYHDETKKKYSMEDQWTERELRKLCIHQNNVLNMSFILRKLLSVNFSLLYFNNVFRFCFIGILLSTVPSMSFAEGISVTSYAMASLMQFYLLCSSVQTLLDAMLEEMECGLDWNLLEVYINFKGFSRDGITSTIASGHIIATIMFEAPCGFSFQKMLLKVNELSSDALKKMIFDTGTSSQKSLKMRMLRPKKTAEKELRESDEVFFKGPDTTIASKNSKKNHTEGRGFYTNHA